MAIDPIRSSDVRARAAEAAAELNERNRAGPEERAESRGDQVDISEEARALAEQAGADSVPVTQAKLAEIQGRLNTGFYDQPEVAIDMARRILEAGDL
jgi:hypothetical protein